MGEGRPRLPGDEARPADRRDRDDDERERRGAGARAGPARELRQPPRAEPAMDRDRPGGERAAADDEDEEPGPARLPDGRVESRRGRGRRTRRRRRSCSRRRARGRPGSRRRRSRARRSTAPIAAISERSLPSGRASGATDWSIQTRATAANAAGPHAIRSGRATPGAASATRAAQRWNGIAPNRIATAIAKARYASPKTAGTATRSPSGRASHAVATIARAPAIASARSSRTPTNAARAAAPTGAATRIPASPPAVAATTAIPGSGRARARTGRAEPEDDDAGHVRLVHRPTRRRRRAGGRRRCRAGRRGGATRTARGWLRRSGSRPPGRSTAAAPTISARPATRERSSTSRDGRERAATRCRRRGDDEERQDRHDPSSGGRVRRRRGRARIGSAGERGSALAARPVGARPAAAIGRSGGRPAADGRLARPAASIASSPPAARAAVAMTAIAPPMAIVRRAATSCSAWLGGAIEPDPDRRARRRAAGAHRPRGGGRRGR